MRNHSTRGAVDISKECATQICPGRFWNVALIGCVDLAGMEDSHVCLGVLRDVERQFAGSTEWLATQISVAMFLLNVLVILPVEDQLHAFVLWNGLTLVVFHARGAMLPVDDVYRQGFKVLLSFLPLWARKRSYIRSRHSLWTSTWVLLITTAL